MSGVRVEEAMGKEEVDVIVYVCVCVCVCVCVYVCVQSFPLILVDCIG